MNRDTDHIAFFQFTTYKLAARTDYPYLVSHNRPWTFVFLHTQSSKKLCKEILKQGRYHSLMCTSLQQRDMTLSMEAPGCVGVGKHFSSGLVGADKREGTSWYVELCQQQSGLRWAEPPQSVGVEAQTWQERWVTEPDLPEDRWGQA